MRAALRVHVSQFTARVVQDALSEASSDYWLRRAAEFERARPVPGEFIGRATTADLRARWQRLTEEAKACRAAAAVVLIRDPEIAADELPRFLVTP